MSRTWKQDDGEFEMSLAREDRPDRPTMVTIRNTSTGSEVVLQPHDAEWLVERLPEVIAAARAGEAAAESDG